MKPESALLLNTADTVESVTTAGIIAVANLHAQIDGDEAQTELGPVALGAGLVDLLQWRGHILGRIVDYERAHALACHLVRANPDDAVAHETRARTLATFHRFPEALGDLDTAERLGLARTGLDDERAAIWQAVGRTEAALALREAAAASRPGFQTLEALATLQAERGQTGLAERLYVEARSCYRGVSPFPVARLDFQHGLMWLGQGDLGRAKTRFDAALRRVPAYTPAQGHLAEVEAAQGQRAFAIARLRPLVNVSDDPDYAVRLAHMMYEEGQSDEASGLSRRAAARYDELTARHPAAFADHAAEFWLTLGADAPRALRLARFNHAARPTPRANALLRRAAIANA